MSSERRTTLAAVVCAALAALLAFSYTGRATKPEGASVSVLLSGSPISAGSVLDERAVAALRSERLPAGVAPVDAVRDSIDLLGARVLVDLPSGSLLTRSLLDRAASDRRFRLRRGERALTVDAVTAPAGAELAPGARVDLFASGFGGAQHTSQLIEAAELLAVEERENSNAARLTLRLAREQVPAVIRADVFARELRAVATPAADR